MAFELSLFNSGLLNAKDLNEVLACNKFTVQYGLSLTESQALELVKTRSDALRANGRIEFGGGIIDKIIKVFCDSDYLSRDNYVETVCGLVEIFYYYKNEMLDVLSDDELIELMKKYFNSSCYGSVELLRERELNKAVRKIRSGYSVSDLFCQAMEEEYDDE